LLPKTPKPLARLILNINGRSFFCKFFNISCGKE